MAKLAFPSDDHVILSLTELVFLADDGVLRRRSVVGAIVVSVAKLGLATSASVVRAVAQRAGIP